MTENNFTPPVRYKQSKRKPLRVLLIGALPVLISLIFLIYNVFSTAAEITESEIDLETVLYVTLALLVAASIIMFIFVYCVWRSDGFCILDDGISYDFTFIVKRQVKLPYDKINTVKIKRTIFDMMLGLSVVQIGSGSGLTANAPEISLCFTKSYAEYFMDYIQKRAAATKEKRTFTEDFTPPSEKEDKTVSVRQKAESDEVTFADKMRAIFTNDLFYFGIIAIVVLPLITNFLNNNFVPEEEKLDFNAFLITAAVIGFLTVAGAFIGTLIRYYDYRIYEQDGCIHISYGLITKNSFSISRDKIRGYTLRQGILQQLFNTGSLRINVIGISSPGTNGQQSITYLYPCAKVKRLNEIIDKYLPEYKFEGETQKAGKHAFLHNFAIPAFWLSLILLPTTLILALKVNLYLFLPLPCVLFIMLLSCLLLKRNSKLGFSDKHLFAQTGGFFKSTFVLRMDAVQEVSSFAGFIRQKQNIRTYRVVYRGDNPLTGSMFLVRNLPAQNLERFK